MYIQGHKEYMDGDNEEKEGREGGEGRQSRGKRKRRRGRWGGEEIEWGREEKR